MGLLKLTISSHIPIGVYLWDKISPSDCMGAHTYMSSSGELMGLWVEGVDARFLYIIHNKAKPLAVSFRLHSLKC